MDNLLKLASVTQALRARDILKSAGIYAKVTRIPASNGKGNCSYGIKVKNRLNDAVSILRDNNIKIGGRAVGDWF